MGRFCGWGRLNNAFAAEELNIAGIKNNKQNLYMHFGIMSTLKSDSMTKSTIFF